MPIDLPSVIAVSTVVTGAVGFLLLYSWRQSGGRALLFWGAADLLVSAGTGAPLVSTALAEGDFIEVANAAVLLGYGLFWAGIRSFEGRPVGFAWAAAGAVVWLVASEFPAFQDNPALRVALSFLISGAYVTASALLVARGRTEPLVSRNAAIFLLSIHSVILIGRVSEAILSWQPDHAVSRSQLFAAFALENLLFTVAMAFILLAMMKERLEAVQKDRAYTDLLTGAPNRRAFFERGEATVKESRDAGAATALVLFDLDRFKQINDEQGHETGDRTLLAFAEVARSELRPKDHFARIGGEEFACLLPGLSLKEAAATADRIRAVMASTEVAGTSNPFQVTVSAGVAVSAESSVALDDLLRGADKALYEAKAGGRNRVEMAKPDLVVSDGQRLAAVPVRPGSVVRGFRKRA